MIRRPRRTVPATIVGLVLLAVAVVVAISCIQLIAGSAPLIPFTAVGQYAAATSLDNPAVLAAGAVLALLGLVLLACALLPGTPQVLALAPTPSRGNDDTAAGVARHSLARDLTSHALRADGITDARVTITPRAVRVRARTPLRDHSGLAEQVQKLIEARLGDINLARPARVRISITSDRSAS